jgi:hypothetical protein
MAAIHHLMTTEEKIVAVGKVLHPILLDPTVSDEAKRKVHDALNDLTGAIVALDRAATCEGALP